MAYDINYSVISCGVHQVSGLYTRSKDPVGQFCRAIKNHWDTSAHYLFSDKAYNSPGFRLAAGLRKKYPGSIRMSPIAVNPNSMNEIRVWIFTPPKGFWRTYKKRRARR